MIENKDRRSLLDWLWDLLIRAIRERKFERATEAHRVMDKVYNARYSTEIDD